MEEIFKVLTGDSHGWYLLSLLNFGQNIWSIIDKIFLDYQSEIYPVLNLPSHSIFHCVPSYRLEIDHCCRGESEYKLSGIKQNFMIFHF